MMSSCPNSWPRLRAQQSETPCEMMVFFTARCCRKSMLKISLQVLKCASLVGPPNSLERVESAMKTSLQGSMAMPLKAYTCGHTCSLM